MQGGTDGERNAPTRLDNARGDVRVHKFQRRRMVQVGTALTAPIVDRWHEAGMELQSTTFVVVTGESWSKSDPCMPS